MERRGQSTQVGVVLLTVVVVATSATTAALVFSGPLTSADSPSLELTGRVTADADAVVLTNSGGDAIEFADLYVVVAGPGGTAKLNRTTVDGDRTFSTGEQWNQSLSADALDGDNLAVSVGDTVSVIVVHEPSGRRLFDGEKRVTAAPDGGVAGNVAPNLTVTAARTILEAPGSVPVEASATDPEGDPVTYEWRIVDGASYSSLSSESGSAVTLDATAVTANRTVTVEVSAYDGYEYTRKTVTVSLTPDNEEGGEDDDERDEEGEEEEDEEGEEEEDEDEEKEDDAERDEEGDEDDDEAGDDERDEADDGRGHEANPGRGRGGGRW